MTKWGEVLSLPPLGALSPLPGGKEWDLSRFESRPCPVCAAGEKKDFCRRPDGLIVHQCLSCGMLYLSHVPSEEALRDFYQGYSQAKRRKTLFPSLRRCRAAWRNNFYVEILETTGGLRGKKVLDVGCGDGWLLELCAGRGAEVAGVEKDRQVSAAIKTQGVPVTEEIEGENLYDIICALQVLEHLRKPAEMVEAVSRALKPEGRFLISVPNAGEVIKIGPTWVGFRVDLEHLNYFTLESLARLLLPCQLYIEQFWEHAQPSLGHEKEGTPSGLWLAIWPSLLRRLTWSSWRHAAEAVSRGTFVLTVLARRK